ncbi:uncharacterized protein A1O9_09189 [Exophiala aquamarina CBS 119918]|uniref:Peptidase A1 domain-containing protein n=1 Tax=Exophiala aquamarina CBS 119918 TaxID=1182545 RepID=A0A072P4V6_9EURO|nr:uncharacterized protein A1O9_09189 [Exophiala aquamarina CBS 119918]KEF54747.1 hypothetical protein A1O9_09189 [Exophiala aquamarina CBS 119918]
MEGYAFYSQNRFTIHRNGDLDQPGFLDGLAVLVSNNLTVNFPGGAAYTVDVGLFSLIGSQDEVRWTGTNGSNSFGNASLSTAYNKDYIPSISFGLHIGSVEPEIEGSLILGGYDSSRCITEPIVSDTTSFNLLDISLNVSRGASAFLKTTAKEVNGLLKVNGASSSGVKILPEPGLPYMYLPRDTCDAIAAHLPVSYNADFNIYLWDTDSPAYSDIVSSPHALAFSFENDGTTETINVPFALLNLTLDSPLTAGPTPYFPCSPWTATSDVPYTLGRAFLQAAFLSHNANTNKHFLAQAPGPDLLAKNVKRIGSTDTTLAGAVNAPDWDSTWERTLKALSSNSTSAPDPNSGSGQDSSSGISGGAIAGIVIGVVIVIAVAAGAYWFLARRRRQANPPAYDNTPSWAQKPPVNTMEMPTAAQVQGPYDPSPAKGYYGHNQAQPAHEAREMPATQPIPELESDSRSRAVELSTER